MELKGSVRAGLLGSMLSLSACGGPGGVDLVSALAGRPPEEPAAIGEGPQVLARGASSAASETTEGPSTTEPVGTDGPQEVASDPGPDLRPGRVTATLAVPTGNPDTSALLLEKSAPSEAQVGEAYDYELRLTNLTTVRLDDVTVTDLLAGVEVLEAEPAADPGAAGEMTWRLGPLEAGEVRTIRVRARAAQPGSVLTSSIVRYDQVLSMTTQIVQPILGLRIEVPEEQFLCEPLDCRLVVINSGTGTARGVTLSAELPSGLVVDGGGRELSLVADSIAAGAYREFPVRLRATRGGSYALKVAMHGADEQVLEASSSLMNVIEPVLAVNLEGPARALAEQAMTYHITVRNTGLVPAPGVTLEQVLPEWCSVLKAGNDGRVVDGAITWDLGRLEPSASRTLEVMLSRSVEGLAVHRVIARGYSARDVSDRVRTEYRGVPDVQLEVIDSDDPVGLGNGTTYTITATNHGSAADHDVRVLGSWDRRWRYVACSGPTAGLVQDEMVTFGSLDRLGAKEKAVWKVQLQGRGAGDSTFKVIMTTRDRPRPVEQGEATILYR